MVELEPPLEPVIDQRCQRTTTSIDDGARGDLRVYGFKTAGRNTFFDFTMTDTGCVSSKGRSSESLLREAEQAKRAKYEERIEPYDDFIPLAMSVYGMMSSGAEETLIKATRNAALPDRHDALFMARMSLQFATAKAVARCIRPPVASAPLETREDGEDTICHPAGEVLEDPGIAAADSTSMMFR